MVKTSAVLDSTCLIGLERIQRLDLLRTLLEEAWVPPAVQREFGTLPSWVSVRKPADAGMVKALHLVVDQGEAEAIALAYETGLRVILDDRKAREAAQQLGIPVTGTVGLLPRAKQTGKVPAILPLLDALQANHFRIADALRNEALRLANE